MKASLTFLVGLALCSLSSLATAQVNSGSNGSDGAFNPAANVTIDMADHPDGIYHYTSVNILSGVTVTFSPNAENTPVIWLVQGDCLINGTIDVSGSATTTSQGAKGGPGGWRGGSAASPLSQSGEGPGGGTGANKYIAYSGAVTGSDPSGGTFASVGLRAQPDKIYGNVFILPLLGGSGGGGGIASYWHGNTESYGGGGGGGAILIASSGNIVNNGNIKAIGGNGVSIGGSGGAIRLVTNIFGGSGSVTVAGGGNGGSGRIRLDILQSTFSGSLQGTSTQGFQPIILPAAGQSVQLGIASIGGVQVVGVTGGVLANPDVTIPAQQNNPLNVVVNCTNIPLNTDIAIKIHPANGADVTATAKNTAGTQAASTATIPVNMPRGGGIMYASAVTGLFASASATPAKDSPVKNIAQTGWTTKGETFVSMEITAAVGGRQRISYITDTGKHYAVPN